MPRTFDLSVESPATVDQILSAFADEEYWRARLALFTGGTAMLESLTVDEDEAVSVLLNIDLFGDRLPKVITQLRRGDLRMVRSEKWSRTDQGRVRGDVDVKIHGAPLTAGGEALVEPHGAGSRMTYAMTLSVKVPLVGGKIESFMVGQTIDEITRLQEFTTEWVAAKG